jgi:hypothetical protein
MNKPLIVKLFGGLGNQMFQYAAGRALSLRSGRRLLIDASFYQHYQHHQGFELKKVFHCPIGVVSAEELNKTLGLGRFEWVQRIFSTRLGRLFSPRHWLIEPHFHFWKEFASQSSPVFMKGHWQSERYFMDVREDLIKDFDFQIPLGSKNHEARLVILNSNSVSIHVRRGDYVKNPKAFATHGVCSVEYYQQAIEFLSSKLQSPKFFVFSDDMKWVRENLKLGSEVIYVDWNTGADSHKDMHLMSLCKHNIVANSSFSWWGAWLNKNPSKMVIAPICWFAADIDDRDLIPSEWVRL